MSEWWTYHLSDFLLFSPRTYYRLFELYNADIWPAQVLGIALGGAILVLMLQDGRRRRSIAAIFLAACWIFVAWAFQLERYATINWAAVYFAIGFAVEALLLVLIAIAARPLPRQLPKDGVPWIGAVLLLFAVVMHPLIGPLAGRTWAQVEIFGMAPDPTAIGTLGYALLAGSRSSLLLLPIPLLWCGISGATLWTMEAPDAFVPPLAALLALSAAIWHGASPRRGSVPGV